MRSAPPTIGSALIAASLLALLSPLISLLLRFLDLSLFPWEDQPASPSWHMIFTVANAIAFILQKIVILLPRMVACSMTAYIGVCLGYVGVHLRLAGHTS
mmetsp:Transcript_5018/g.11472  ORF Transcript_5018/g.11472 Transcript_5018/m.11472 type:complete len:100 (-) Transcript_5018:367-666(-)